MSVPDQNWSHGKPARKGEPKPHHVVVALIVVVFVAASVIVVAVTRGSTPVLTQATGVRPPNIVIINTDDQRWDTLKYMPNVEKLLVAHGITFRNAFVTNPTCCPSRASLFSGQYSHTTKVYSNTAAGGGFKAFNEGGTVATALDGDYETGLFGKYLNNYFDAATHGYIPIGWDEWNAFKRDGYNDYYLNVNGTLRHFQGKDEANYSNSVLTSKITSFIARSEEPVFVYFAPPAPHEPVIPEPRDERSFSHLAKWRPPSYNEADISDKPRYMQSVEPISSHSAATIDEFRKDQLRTLQSVDRSVGDIVEALDAKGELDNTMIVYTSDNGMLWGEHRMKGKGIGFEEAIRVPLVIRYDPLIPAARNDDHLVAGFDITPTAVQLAGIGGLEFEGESLVPLFHDARASWRHDLLIEHWARGRNSRPPTMCMIRSERFAYMHYFWGNKDELYDLSKDPFELQNEISNPSYANDLSQLKRREQELCDPPPPGTPKISIP